jgi:GNAT superfamily N-acetyltransferase
MEAVTFRPATPADAPAIAAIALEGFRTYTTFAPPDWQPPDSLEAHFAAEFASRIDDRSAWVLVAEQDGRVVGHSAFLPATESSRRVEDPELAHLWQLFVARDWWGTGVAVRLHDAALPAAAGRGFTSMRLFTPARQARARRFYEREGWAVAGPPFYDERIGFDIVEYRRSLAEITGS